MDTQRMRAEMGQELTTEGRIRVAHDGKLAIASGGSRFETSWKNREATPEANADTKGDGDE